ncbi:MAG TPA: GNAT family N-acetyltransferase [Nitrobacter sp.]|jgi:GNAT superfamily N-acetyltransferase|nr:GNAT family N-acetyltransferase [Nitrobacter sp.]
MLLREAHSEELAALTELCLRSKAVWGYDADFMRACRAELTLTPAALDQSHVQVAEIGGCPAGIVQVSIRGDEAQLDKLFVAPDRLRSGVGRDLLLWAAAKARKSGACTLVIEADPGAAAFYKHFGAVDDGLVPSGSITGRFLPRLVLALKDL